MAYVSLSPSLIYHPLLPPPLFPPLTLVFSSQGLLLCDYIERHPFQSGSRVLELGAGTGIVGLFAAKRTSGMCVSLSPPSLSPTHSLTHSLSLTSPPHSLFTFLCDIDIDLTLTDLEELVPLMEENVSLNKLSPSLTSVLPLKWGSTSPLSLSSHSFDIVVGADVLYVDRDIFDDLLITLLEVVKGKTICFLSGARRHTFEETYLSLLRKDFTLSAVDISDLVKENKKGNPNPNPNRNPSPNTSSKSMTSCVDDGVGLEPQTRSPREVSEEREREGKGNGTRYRNPDHLYLWKLMRKEK